MAYGHSVDANSVRTLSHF